ncbi:MAG TPA: 50S ribosomal protein L10 [Candidatus Norongarragalinales archaeon]|jgi:large subunit ribosomal protein L10|nr:50S ribosomal protein L10 [Candidatus Norongarragalinales archaeon]
MPISKQQKSEVVKHVQSLCKKYPVVAAVSLQNLPSKHFNAIKKKLRGQAEIVVARATLLERAVKAAAPEKMPLIEKFQGSAALIFTNLDPFKLSKLIRQNRAKAPAKPGAIAPMDITVPAGETSLAPGPVLTELKQAKIDAKIQGTKVVINKDSTVAKKGEPISEPVARILTKLGIEPFEIGLTITAAFADGMVYGQESLEIDEAQLILDMISSHQKAVNLAVSAEIYNAFTTPLILVKAVRNAMAVTHVAKLDTAPETPVEGTGPPAEPTA